MYMYVHIYIYVHTYVFADIVLGYMTNQKQEDGIRVSENSGLPLGMVVSHGTFGGTLLSDQHFFVRETQDCFRKSWSVWM